MLIETKIQTITYMSEVSFQVIITFTPEHIKDREVLENMVSEKKACVVSYSPSFKVQILTPLKIDLSIAPR